MENAQSVKQGNPKKWRRWLLFGIPVVLATVVFFPLATAFGFFWGNGHCMRDHRIYAFKSDKELFAHMQDKLNFVLERLNATDQQKVAIRKIVQDSSGDILRIHQKGHELHREFTEALLGDPVDHQRLEKIRKQFKYLTDEAGELTVDCLGRISEELTPEQRSEVYQFIQFMHGEE